MLFGLHHCILMFILLVMVLRLPATFFYSSVLPSAVEELHHCYGLDCLIFEDLLGMP